jgi:glycerate kinase
MTRILLAPDSFKGTLWAWEVCEALERGFRRSGVDAEFIHLPLADGGEGTAQVIGRLTGAEFQSVTVTGPIGDSVVAFYALDRMNGRAVMDMASAAGLPLVPPDLRNPLSTTTFGVGQLILSAMEQGCEEIILGVGGSATVDGGLGCLIAMGAVIHDAQGNALKHGAGGGLHRVAGVDLTVCRERLSGIRLSVAVDVQNPLLGANGAAPVFGPQKGANPEQVEALEQGLNHWAGLLEKEVGRAFREEPGMGASGGLSFGLAAVGARIVPGARLVLQIARMDHHLAEADLVITGEGMLDSRTFFGKVPLEVLRMCVPAGKPCIMIAGKVEASQPWLDEGATAVVPVLHGLCAEPDTREEAESLLEETAFTVAYLLGADVPRLRRVRT